MTTKQRRTPRKSTVRPVNDPPAPDASEELSEEEKAAEQAAVELAQRQEQDALNQAQNAHYMGRVVGLRKELNKALARIEQLEGQLARRKTPQDRRPAAKKTVAKTG